MQATIMVIIRPGAAEVCVWNNELYHPDLPLGAQVSEALISHFPLSATGAVVLAHMLLTAAIKLVGGVEPEPTPEQLSGTTPGYAAPETDEPGPGFDLADKQRIESILGDLEIDLP